MKEGRKVNKKKKKKKRTNKEKKEDDQKRELFNRAPYFFLFNAEKVIKCCSIVWNFLFSFFREPVILVSQWCKRESAGMAPGTQGTWNYYCFTCLSFSRRIKFELRIGINWERDSVRSLRVRGVCCAVLHATEKKKPVTHLLYCTVLRCGTQVDIRDFAIR